MPHCGGLTNIAMPGCLQRFLAAIVVAGWLQVAAAGPNGPVERIVSLAPHLTELAYAAGAGDKLVGTVEYSDFPLEAGRLPRIGDAFRIDYEQVALLEPDLVLAWGSGTPAEIIAKLTALGYRVIELEPGSIESIAAELRQIGTLAGTSDIAERSALLLLNRSTALQHRYAGKEPRRVFFQISAEPLYTVSGSHVISEIIEDCGGINVFAAAANIAPAVSKEAIVAAKPDVILAATSPGDDDWADVWRSWQQIPAVRDGHLFGIDRDLISRSGPRIVDGALQVCEALEKSRALPGKQLNY
jgi:iron complex transport system substrate-binding protein